MFYFQEIQRLQLFFDSPNKLAAFLCIVSFCCIGLFSKLKDSANLNCKKLSYLFLGMVIVFEFMILMTYSRGAYVAFTVCLIILFCIESHKICLFIACCWGLGLFVLPKVLIRAIDIDLVKDLSIQHRLILWQQACNMIYSYFPFRIPKTFEQMYWAWYQPIEKRQTYITAVNDYLTLGVNNGILLLMLYIFIISVATINLLLLRKITGQKYYSGFACAIIAYIICSFFSTFYNNLVIFSTFIFLILFSFVLLIKTLRKILFIVICATIVTIASFLIIFIIGFHANRLHDLQYKYIQIDSSECVILQKTNSNPKRIIVYLFDKTDFSLEYEGKITLRRLLDSECYVIGMGVEPDEVGLEQSQKLLKYIENNFSKNFSIYLIGQNCGARYAILLAGYSKKIKGIACIGAYAQWPIDKLSPIDNLSNIKNIPLIIIHGENDLKVSCEEAVILANTCKKFNINNHLLIVKAGTNYFESVRQNILVLVLKKLKEMQVDHQSI